MQPHTHKMELACMFHTEGAPSEIYFGSLFLEHNVLFEQILLRINNNKFAFESAKRDSH